MMDTVPSTPANTVSAGAAFLSRLRSVGVDYIFANSGTDFPPVIEGLAEAEVRNMELPQAVVIPYEGAAMAMAHGYYLASGRAQAVMAHTNVGLANCAIGAINAATENVPVLLISGRTPVTEHGRFGARTVPIGWGQEMRDQTAMVRETCKWDYELRFPEQVNDMVDRAWAIANSTPKGPVYMALPREVLCEHIAAAPGRSPCVMRPVRGAAAPIDIACAADLLAGARAPVIFAQRGAGGRAGFAALAELAETWAIPVCQYWAVQLAMGTDHAMASGADPALLLDEADVVLVIDALAPWAPDKASPRSDATVIQLGPDPLQARFPIRNFAAHLSLPGETEDTLLSVVAAMPMPDAAQSARADRRRIEIGARNDADRRSRASRAELALAAPRLNKAAVSLALSKAIAGRNFSIFSELGCQLPYMKLTHPGSWFDGPLSGGLGWGFPAAMGFKLADPSRRVVATMGDGSYIFANPVACHQIAEALGLSILVIVLNNAEWGAVRQSIVDIYPDGYAARSNRIPLTSLSPSPDYTKIAEASRAFVARADNAEGLEIALSNALAYIEEDRGTAFIEVAISN